MNGDIPSRLYQSIDLDQFKQVCCRTIEPSTYPLACKVEQNIPIYDLTEAVTADVLCRLQDEWHHILHTGPGVFVLRNMYAPARYGPTLSATNEAFDRIIAKERQSNATKGDHFASGGTNDRIWNSFAKHCIEDPTSFVDYYSNPWLASVCAAWLGPAYRVTAQVNAVHPGGAAQEPHRDYHLGFQDVDATAQYPAPTQLMSQFLTLQGAVAHTDMPVPSGPTRFLPFSQTYAPGYLAYKRPEFRSFFEANYVALPLALGDGVFFNPALFHAAGANMTDPTHGGFRRVANLLQVSSAFGKPMEMIDSLPLVDKCWNILVRRYQDAGNRLANSDDPDAFSFPEREIRAFIQALAEGYPFPTNLDLCPPAPGGMAPESEQAMLVSALQAGWTRVKVINELELLGLKSHSKQI